jgi:hypothetical protein
MTAKQIAALIAFVFLATAACAQTNRDGDLMEGQVRFGFDAQDYNTGRTSQVGSIDATVRIVPRLTLEVVASGGAYFGAGFGGGAAYITVKPAARTYLTIGGSRNSDTGTTVAWSGSVEAGRNLYQSRRSMIRGLETDFNLTARGYHFSPFMNVLLVNPTVVVYLPRDWALTLRAGAIQTTMAGTSTWTPSGGAKLNIPLARRFSISPQVSFDSEVSDVLQLTNISSREFGVGVRSWLTRRTSVEGYYFRVLYGTNQLADDSYGVSYALRF